LGLLSRTVVRKRVRERNIKEQLRNKLRNKITTKLFEHKDIRTKTNKTHVTNGKVYISERKHQEERGL
jgi:hypothetical protein